MNAKSGAKASPPKPATATKSATSSKPAGKAVPGKSSPADDFPFEEELTAGKSAIAAMPNPTRQRSLQVICPMCDTSGYVPPSAAGQDVRCANPKCVMPVFTAPAPPKKEETPPPPPPPKSNNLMFVGGVTTAILLCVGAGLYFINMQPSNTAPAQKQLSDEAKEAMAEMTGGGAKNANSKVKPTGAPQQGRNVPAANTKANPAETTASGADENLSTDALVQTALKQMKEACLQSDRQRSKPLCRQLTAEANAITGNFDAVRDNLKQMAVVGGDDYYRITPLLEMFWTERAAGNQKEAGNSLSQALTEAPKIPKFGRTRLEITGRLAVALVVFDQAVEAHKLIDQLDANDADAQLAARIQISSDGQLVPLADSFSVLPWKAPQAVAVTAGLMNRGDFDKARAWSTEQPNDDGKTECLAYWAEELAFRKGSPGAADVDGQIAAVTGKLPPVLASRVWSRAGLGRWRAKDRDGAAAAAKLATESLGTVTVPPACAMPEFKLTERFSIPAGVPLIQAATSAAELANLQAQQAETKSAAETSLDLALSFLDGSGPSLTAAQQRQAEVDRMGAVGLRERLKAELKKRNDDEARIAANNFKRKLDDLVKAAETRFQTEVQILSRLRGAGVGLNTKVWLIVDARSRSENVAERDNFMATELPGELAEGLKGTTEEQAIRGEWQSQSNGAPLPRPAAVQFAELLNSDLTAAVKFVQSVPLSNAQREELILKTVTQLPADGKLPLALQFIEKLESPVQREDCYLAAALVGASHDQAGLVAKQANTVVQQTEKAALCRGLVGGVIRAGNSSNRLSAAK